MIRLDGKERTRVDLKGRQGTGLFNPNDLRLQRESGHLIAIDG